MNGLDDRVDILSDTIYAIEENIPASDREHYRFPLLLHLDKHLTAFSPSCQVCRYLKRQIVSLCDDLVRNPRMTRGSFRNYLHVLKIITGHLKMGHRLVEKRQYAKRFLCLGLAASLIMVVFTLILLSFGITLFTFNIMLPALVARIAIGYTAGHIIDKIAERRGKVL